MKNTRRDWLAIILLVASSILFGCALLTVFSAPTSILWIVAILVSEFGYYVALIALVLAALAWRRSRTSFVLALVAAALCLAPIFRAIKIGRTLPARCTEAFGLTNADESPFRFAHLFGRISSAGIEVNEQTYATDGAKTLKLDLYRRRDASTPLPIIVMIHGGSWKGGTKSMLPAENFHLAREGYAVAAIEYRHAPQSPFPAALDDVFRAVDFLKTLPNEWHLDPTRIALIGRSAGGQLALSAAYSGREANIRGVVAFYAPSDLVLGYEQPSRRFVLNSRKVLEDYLGGAPNERPQTCAAASPINFVNDTTPPTLLIHGLLDPIVWPNQSKNLAEKLRAARRPSLLLEIPWGTHGCDANPAGPTAQLSRYTIDRFLAATLR